MLALETKEIKLTDNTKKSRRPSHIVWQVIGEGEDARWIRVGAAWENRDKKGLSLQFDSYPVVGRTVIRVAPEPETGDRDEGR
jgi:hypothetical protein